MAFQSRLQPGVEIRDFHSTIMDQTLQLFIKLPIGYEDEALSYPVLFVLDANQSFPMYTTLSIVYEKFLQASQRIIFVGVGYKTNNDRSKALAQFASWRTRDLTPTKNPAIEEKMQNLISHLMSDEKEIVHTGMAERFIRVLNEEIIPCIETNYQVLHTKRGLAGYSFGGLFTLYALFHSPETFTHYLAGSPSMWDALFKYEELFAANHTDLQAQVYMSAGSLENDTLLRLKKFAERLESRGYPSLKLKTDILENENHFTAMPASTTHGLCWHYYPKIMDM